MLVTDMSLNTLSQDTFFNDQSWHLLQLNSQCFYQISSPRTGVNKRLLLEVLNYSLDFSSVSACQVSVCIRRVDVTDRFKWRNWQLHYQSEEAPTGFHQKLQSYQYSSQLPMAHVSYLRRSRKWCSLSWSEELFHPFWTRCWSLTMQVWPLPPPV